MTVLGEAAKRPRLLVVDDERSNLALLTLTLRNEGYEVVACSNGVDAIARSMEQPPDLALLDIMMPGMDGFQVLDRMKERPETSRIPVIFLSGMEDLSSKLRGFSLGAVDYVTKPFHIEELRARVRIHLQLAQSRRAIVEEQSRKLETLVEAQRQLLRHPEELPQARFAVHFASREEVGGDLYDVVEPAAAIHGYFVADASGHDIGTSLVAAGARALLRQNASPVWSPEQTFSLANDALVTWIPPGKYLTAVYACLNRLTGHLSLVSAAHPPCLVLPRLGEPWLVELSGDVLGAFSGAHFGTRDIHLMPGDRVVLYSDGLVEDPDDGILWNAGLARLLEAARRVHDVPLADLPRLLAENLVGERNTDDVVVLAFEY